MDIRGVLILFDKPLVSQRKVSKNVPNISDQLSDAPKKRRGRRPRQESEKPVKSEAIIKKKKEKRSPKKSPKKESKKNKMKNEKPTGIMTPVEFKRLE